MQIPCCLNIWKYIKSTQSFSYFCKKNQPSALQINNFIGKCKSKVKLDHGIWYYDLISKYQYYYDKQNSKVWKERKTYTIQYTGDSWCIFNLFFVVLILSVHWNTWMLKQKDDHFNKYCKSSKKIDTVHQKYKIQSQNWKQR